MSYQKNISLAFCCSLLALGSFAKDEIVVPVQGFAQNEVAPIENPAPAETLPIDEEPAPMEEPAVAPSSEAEPATPETAPENLGNVAPEAAPAQPQEEPEDRPQEPVESIEPEAVPPEPEPELSEEIKLMQEIEPGFLPKDQRALQLFMLQRAAAESDASIKKKRDLAESTRALFTKKFREDLLQFISKHLREIDVKLDASMDDAIKHYEVALKNSPDHPLYAPDAMYTLGLYYYEQDEKEYFEKLARYNEAREQGREDVPYPEENFGRTIDLYEKLIEKYPDFRYMDSAIYLLGLALWYEGAFYNAVDRFEALIKRFPDSRYVEELWFRLGEYFYDMDEFNNAIDAYEKVSANPKSPLYDKAIYKTGWSYFQKDRFMDAIAEFVKVLELTYKETGEGAQAGMKAEVTRYIVKSFSEMMFAEEESRPRPTKPGDKEEKEYAERMGVKLTEKISAHFKALGNPPYLRDILIETASQLLDEGKADGAILAFQKTIALNPKHEDNPRLSSQIVDILQEAGRVEDARKANHGLVRRYNKNSQWFKSQEGSLKARAFAREAVRDAMLALAVHYHRMGKELKDAKDVKGANANLRRAASLYSSYLHEYPEREDTYKAIFYFAEAAYDLGRYRAALDAYQKLKDYPLPLPEGTRRDATINIVFTFRHVLENEAKRGRFKEIDFDSLTSKQRGLEPEEIPEMGKNYLGAIEEFLKIAPNDDQVPVLYFHAAAIYYVYGHEDEAMARFNFIIDTYPQSSAASVAARLILDDAIAKEDWPLVLALSKRFREANLGGAQSDFARIEGNARFKIARGLFEEANELHSSNQLGLAKEKYKEASALFLALLEEDPKNPNADVMLFNSARAVERSGTTTEALPLYRRLYTQYPNSDFAKPARFQEALALEKMLKFADAAKAYDGIIKQDPKSESAGDAMLNKALLYEAAGDLNNATIAFIDFAKRYPDRVEAPDAYLSAAANYKKMGKINQQIGMLEQFIKQYQKDPAKRVGVIEAHVQIADTYTDLQNASPAARKKYEKPRLDHYRSAVALYSPELASPLAAYFAAKAQLILEKPEQDSFKNLTINARMGKAQGEQLAVMMKKLTELSAMNEAIIKAYAQPVWNAESLRRIGVLYEHLAKTMIKAPCPRDVAAVDEFACDEYMVLLEDKAAVLEEKALSAYKQSYEIAMSAPDAPPELITNILAGLNRLRPGEYQRVGDLIQHPQIGVVYGQGRMLSSGKMASTLHPKEADPDKTPKALPEPEVVEPAPVEAPAEEQGEPDQEEGEPDELDEFDDESAEE